MFFNQFFLLDRYKPEKVIWLPVLVQRSLHTNFLEPFFFANCLNYFQIFEWFAPNHLFLAALTNFFFVSLSSSSCRDNNHLHRKSSNTPEKQHFSRKKKRKAVLLGHPPKMARKPWQWRQQPLNRKVTNYFPIRSGLVRGTGPENPPFTTQLSFVVLILPGSDKRKKNAFFNLVSFYDFLTQIDGMLKLRWDYGCFVWYGKRKV